MAHMMKTTEGLRNARIAELDGTMAGDILRIINDNFDYESYELWGYLEMSLSFTDEQKCLLRGWSALGFCSYTSTLGMNSLTIKNLNSLVRKVYYKTMKDLDRVAAV